MAYPPEEKDSAQPTPDHGRDGKDKMPPELRITLEVSDMRTAVLKEIEERNPKDYLGFLYAELLSQVPKVRLYFVRNLRPALITSLMSE